PLVAQREAARAQAGGQLAQPAAGARIAHRHVDVDRSLFGPAEPRRVDPQGARVRNVRGVEVAGGAVRSDLCRDAGGEQEQLRAPAWSSHAAGAERRIARREISELLPFWVDSSVSVQATPGLSPSLGMRGRKSRKLASS